MDELDVVFVALNPVCDFCSSGRVVVAYLVSDFTIPEFHWGSRGAFAACSACRELIESGKVVELENRSIASFKSSYVTDIIPEWVMRRFVRQLHTEFWLRLGYGGRKQ